MERKTIWRLRQEAGLTQQELADRLGLSNMAVSLWERAKGEPSAAQLRKLADLFGVPMDSIAFEREAAAAERASRKPPEE